MTQFKCVRSGVGQPQLADKEESTATLQPAKPLFDSLVDTILPYVNTAHSPC